MTLRAAEMGWTESQFWAASFVDYNWAWMGYYRKIERSSIDAARRVAVYVNNANSKKQYRSLVKFMRLSIDPKPLTDEQFQEYKASVPSAWYDILNDKKN